MAQDLKTEKGGPWWHFFDVPELPSLDAVGVRDI